MSSFERCALIHDIFLISSHLLLVRVARMLAQNVLLTPDQVLGRGHTVHVALRIKLVSEVCREGSVSEAACIISTHVLLKVMNVARVVSRNNRRLIHREGSLIVALEPACTACVAGCSAYHA